VNVVTVQLQVKPHRLTLLSIQARNPSLKIKDSFKIIRRFRSSDTVGWVAQYVQICCADKVPAGFDILIPYPKTTVYSYVDVGHASNTDEANASKTLYDLGIVNNSVLVVFATTHKE
jgi:hypothetical protein